MKEYSSYSESELQNKRNQIEGKIRFLERTKQEVVKHLSINRKKKWLRSYEKRVCQYKKELAALNCLDRYEENKQKKSSIIPEDNSCKNNKNDDALNNNNINSDNNISNSLGITFLSILFLLALIIFNPQINELVNSDRITGASVIEASDNVYKLYTENATETFRLNYSINSLKISGSIIGNGYVKVDLSYNNTNLLIVNTNNINNNGLLVDRESNWTREENTAVNFDNICIESCSLGNFSEQNITLLIEVKNATFYLTKLSYGVNNWTTKINNADITNGNETINLSEINQNISPADIAENITAGINLTDNESVNISAAEINITNEFKKLKLSVKDRQKQDAANYSVGLKNNKFQLNITKIKKIKNQGRFTVQDGDENEKLSAHIEINGLSTLDQNITAAIDTLMPGNEVERKIKTEVFAANSFLMDNATITLPKNSANEKINAILSCEDFDVENFTCNAWKKTDITFADNGNSITFTVDHFSGYAGADITIINVQSYPMVGGNWTVRFTTNGTEDLIITGVNDTTFGSTLPDDLQFLELKCGTNVLSAIFNGTSIVYSNYSCAEEGAETSLVMTPGKHHQEFKFGDDVKYANNLATSACGTITANAEVNQNLLSNGTCFTLGANNIVIDGSGYAITGNTTSYGIDTAGYDNITIKNFAGINNFTNGIYGSGTVNSTIFNNTIVAANVTNGYGIYLLSSSDANNISANNITTSGSSGRGIYLSSSSNNTLSTNTVTTSRSNGRGIYLDSSSNNNVLTSNTITTSGSISPGINLEPSSNNNVLTSNTITTSGSSSGIEVQSSSNNISNNNINTSGSSGLGISLSASSNNTVSTNNITTSGSDTYGIYLSSSSNNTLSTNIVTASGSSGFGIYVYSSSNNNTLSTNIVTTSGDTGYGIYLASSSNNNALSTNTVTTSGSSGVGIAIVSSSDNNALSTNNITTSGSSSNGITLSASNNALTSNTIKTTSASSAYGVYLSSGTNNTFTNDNITATQANDIRIASGSGTFTNVTFSKTDIGFDGSTAKGNITVKWYVISNISQTNGAALSSANVSGYNISNIIEQSAITGSNGLATLTLTEFVQNATRKLYHTSHSINATATNYLANSTTVNLTLTSSTSVVLSLTPICKNLTSSYTLDQNVNVNGTCFTIGADNIVIDGNGYTITGNTTGYGIDIAGYDNIIIKNFKGINNFINGIYASGTVNSTIFNNTIVAANLDSGYGIYLQASSDANNISNNNITTSGSSGYGIYLQSSSNNNNLVSNLISTNNTNAYSIYFNDVHSNNVITNTLNSAITYDIFLQAGFTNNTFINVTFNKSGIGFNSTTDTSSITVKYYADVTVNTGAGTALQNANVTTYNVSNIIVDSQLTNAAGQINRLTLTEFEQNATRKLYHTPHSINASLAGYYANSTTLNLTLTNSTALTISLTFACGIITDSTVFGNNINVNGTCFQINASNIILDCSGYTITGNNSGYGVNITNRENVTVKNCKLINFSNGVYVTGNGNHTIRDNVINTAVINDIGVYLVNSSNNNISSNIITAQGGGSEALAIANSSNNNIINNNTITASASDEYGILITIGSDNNNLTSNTITTTANGGYGIVIASSYYNFIINTIINSTVAKDIFLVTASINNTLINVTFNKSDIGFNSITDTSSITVKYYTDVTVNTGAGTALQNANVTTYNVSNIIVNSQLTNAAGQINRLTLTEFEQNATRKLYHTPHIFNISLPGYVTNSTSVNLTATSSTVLTVLLTSVCSIITNSMVLVNNINIDGTCFTLGANNIVIDGGGYTITGNTTGYGINTNGYDNVTIKNFAGINNFTNGIFGSGTVNSTIFNNTIVAANVTNGHGIYLQSSSNNNTLSNNNIITSGSSGRGIYLFSSSDNILSINTITTSGSTGFGISLNSSSNNNTLSTNNITTSGSSGVGISLNSSSNNTLSTNTVTTSGSAGYGIYLSSSSNNNALSTNTIKTTSASSAYGVYLDSGTNNTFTNDNITATGVNDIRIASGSGTFTNVTLNKTDIGFDSGATGDITVKWHVTSNISQTNGAALSSANVSGYNISNIIEQSAITGSNGLATLTLTEFEQNATRKLYHTPHSINASLSGYTTNSTTVNLTLTSSTTIVLSLTPICGSLTSSYTLDHDITSTGTCFTLGANNIVIDGNGYTITGNSSGYGIITVGYNNITIKNFAGINNFTNGIYASGVVNSTIFNNTIVAANVASGHGIFIGHSSNNNTLTSNTVTTSGSDAYGIYIYSSSNNTLSINTITTSGSSGYGIYLLSSSNNNALSTNTVTTSGSSGYGIRLSSSSNNALSTNTVTTSGSSGLGIYLDSSSNNILSINTITTSGSSGYGIYLSGSSNNALSTNTVKTTSESSAYGVYLDSGTNNTFTNDNITATQVNDIRIISGSGTFTNVTFNKTDIGFDSGTAKGNITVKWHVISNITQTNGAALSSANVSGYNISNIIEQSAITGSNGLATLTLTEFVQNATRKLYHTPHSINASLAEYIANSTTVNLTVTSSTSVRLSLRLTNEPPTIYSVQCHDGTGNINCNNITYGINLTNITINCIDPDNNINNVTLQLFNKYDNEYKINTGNVTNFVNGFYVYNYMQLIQDSGNWSLNISCIDTNNTIDNYTTNFSLAFGSLSPFLIFPNSENRNVVASQFFNFTSGVYCIGGECENISAILDPGNVNVIFTDQFEESAINTARWNITGSPNITNATSYTGNKSLIVNTSIISYVTKNFTDSIKVGNLSVWFYDSGEKNLTYESQLALIGGEVPFNIGVNSTLNNTHYTYYLNGTFLTEIARTIGWHNILVKVSTVTRIFIDSISIRNTSLITTFTGFELGAKQTSNNTAYFDDFNYTVNCEDSEAECKACSNNFVYDSNFPDTQVEGTYFGNCCGDDSNETFINSTSATDTTDACCNTSTSCIEGSTCFRSGTNTTNYFCTLDDAKLCGQDADNDFALDNDNASSGQGPNETIRDFNWNYCFGNEDTVCGNESNGGQAGDLCDYFGDRTSGFGVCTRFFNNGTNANNEYNDSDLVCAYNSAGYILVATRLVDDNRTGCSVNEGNCTLNETNMILLNSSVDLTNYANRHCVNIQTFDIRNEILNYEIDDDSNACVGCNYTLGTQTCTGEYDYNCTNTNTCEGVCGASSACDEASASNCASNSTLGFCTSSCQINNTFETSQSACDCNQGSTSCSGASCFNTSGNLIAFPQTEGTLGNCCGNNANETFRAAAFNSSLTVSDSTKACCNSTTSCTFNNSCYKNQTYFDVDVNADNDACVEGIWYDCLNNSDCAGDSHCYRRDCDQNPRVRDITISDANVFFSAIIRCRVNVTDAEGMSNVRFNFTAPSGALYQNNGVYDGTQWLSGSITTNETGVWNCTASSNDSSGFAITNITNFTVFKKSELNNGVVSTVNGTKPFYTISRNPTNISHLACLSNLKGLQSCNQTWVVNASGSIGTMFEFYTIYNSTYHNNISAKVNITISGNVTPIVTVPVIIPAVPYRNNNLNCSWIVLDQDTPNVTVNITWSLNGIENKTETIICLESAACYAPGGILNTTISKLQNWSCDVIAFDGSSYSANKNLTVTIQNSPPAQITTISNISWYEDTNYTNAINLDAYFTDIDGDILNYTTTSTQNVTITINYTSFNISLYPTTDYNAELYTAQYMIINATDGTNTTSSNHVYLTIANTGDCGYNGCESGETCSSCSQDCGQCASASGGSAPAAPIIVAPLIQIAPVINVEQKIKTEQETSPIVIAAAVVTQVETPKEAAVEAPTVIDTPIVIRKAEAGDASNEIKVTLKESENTIINVGNEEHSLTIDKINYISNIAINSIDLVIQSRYIKLNILVGETKYVDFEDDKKDDLSVTLLEIFETIEGRYATLKIIDLKTGKALINKLFTLFKQDTAVAIQDAVACISINKTDKSKAAQEKVKIRQTTLDRKTILPKGLDMTVQPFALNCQGSTVSLTLNIPNNAVELQALKCNNGICKNIQLIRLDELNCGDKIKEEAFEKTAAPKRVEKNESLNETYDSRNKVKVIGILDEELVKQITPKVTVPDEDIKQPENPNLKILSPPINIEFNNIEFNKFKDNSFKDNLDIEIVMPYVTDPQVDKNSISIYAKNIQLDEWVLIDSRINPIKRTITSIVRNISKYIVKKEVIDNETQSITQIYTGEFTLIGTICNNCEFSAFENIYFPAETSKATVILVHGLGSTPASFNAIINDIRLTKEPWQAWIFGYPSNRSSLDNGIELADNIERYNKEFQDIYIVAHSLGGLVTQKALNYAYEHNKVNASAYTFINKTKKAILLGVPNDKVAGSELFKQLFKYIINVRTQTGLFNADSVGIKELAYGQVIPKVPMVEYLVIAGTKPYVIETALFTVRSDELFGLNESNDGIVTVSSAQHIGGEYVNNRCKNYWEIPETHTDLIKNPTGRQIIEGIISREISKDIKNKAILGKNKYIELTIPDCSSEDKYVVVGKKIAEEKVTDASGCSCGNGFCGQDEDKISCPSDCANIIRKETVCSSSFFSIIVAGLLLAIAGVIASVYLINAERVKLTALIRKLCMVLVFLLLPVAGLNIVICGKIVMKISAEIILITIFIALFFVLKKKPKTEIAIKEIEEKVVQQSQQLQQQPSEKRNAMLKFLIKIVEVIIEENRIFFLKLFYSKEKFSEIMEMRKTTRENKLLEKEERRKAEIAKKILHKRELFNAEYAELRNKIEELEKNRQQQQMLREKRLHSLEHAREVRLKHIYERKAAEEQKKEKEKEELEKNRQQQQMLREKRLHSLEHAREVRLKHIYERKAAEEQKKEKRLIEKEERRKAEIAKKILHKRELFNAEYAELRNKMEKLESIATEEHKNILKEQKKEAEKQEKAEEKKQKKQHRINKMIKIIEQKVFEAYAHLRLMDIKKAIILYQQAVKLRNNLPIKDKLRLSLPLSRVKAMVILQREVLLNELKAKKLMYNTNESKLSKRIEDNDKKNIKLIIQLRNEQKILRSEIGILIRELKAR